MRRQMIALRKGFAPKLLVPSMNISMSCQIALLKEFAAKLATKSFIPSMNLQSVVKLSFREKTLPQNSQINFLSPVWTVLCVVRWFLCVKDLPQILQWNFLIPVWIFICLARLQFRMKVLLRISLQLQPALSTEAWDLNLLQMAFTAHLIGDFWCASQNLGLAAGQTFITRPSIHHMYLLVPK